MQCASKEGYDTLSISSLFPRKVENNYEAELLNSNTHKLFSYKELDFNFHFAGKDNFFFPHVFRGSNIIRLNNQSILTGANYFYDRFY